jgi:hypothetical protein
VNAAEGGNAPAGLLNEFLALPGWSWARFTPDPPGALTLVLVFPVRIPAWVFLGPVVPLKEVREDDRHFDDREPSGPNAVRQRQPIRRTTVSPRLTPTVAA